VATEEKMAVGREKYTNIMTKAHTPKKKGKTLMQERMKRKNIVSLPKV